MEREEVSAISLERRKQRLVRVMPVSYTHLRCDEFITLIYKLIECFALFLYRTDGVYAGFLPHLVDCLLAFG